MASIVRGGIYLTVGICVPSTCTSNDAAILANNLLDRVPLNTSSLPPFTATCIVEPEYDAKAIAAICVCSVILLIMAVATVIDIYLTCWSHRTSVRKYELDKTNGLSPKTQDVESSSNGHIPEQKSEQSRNTELCASDERGTLMKLLLSFSVYTNCRKILSTRQPSGTLTAVNGIRFISMTWVILGHTFSYAPSLTENAATYFPALMKTFAFQAVTNASVSVDTFFVLSGLLVSYLSLKEMKKIEGPKKFRWGMFYFHRFWRLTPPYMLFLMFYVTTGKYWFQGPMWSPNGMKQEDCIETWWSNLLYINNFYKTDKMCMGWTWYLANDMQFYVISPLILVPLYYSRKIGTVICFLLVAVGCITTGILSKHYALGSTLRGGNNAALGFHEVYMKPYCRIGTYVIGVYTGYLLCSIEKPRIPKVLNMVGWAVSTGVAIISLYGLYTPDGSDKLNVDTSALYNATFRVAWSLCIAWVIFACATGNGGPVNKFLSWRAMIPLSRLTYCAYLVHPVVIYVYYSSRHRMIHFDNLEVIYIVLGNVCISYAVALVVSLAFESPMMGLEKALLGKRKKNK